MKLKRNRALVSRNQEGEEDNVEYIYIYIFGSVCTACIDLRSIEIVVVRKMVNACVRAVVGGVVEVEITPTGKIDVWCKSRQSSVV